MSPLNPYDDLLEQMNRDQPAVPAGGAPDPRVAALERVLDRDEREGDIRLRARVKEADTTNPETIADHYRLSRRLGVPLSFVERNYDTLKRRADVEDTSAAGRSAPALGAWVAADHANAVIARDDLAPLSAMDRTLGIGRNLLGAGAAGLARIGAGVWGAVQAGAEWMQAIDELEAGTIATAEQGLITPGTVKLTQQPKVRNPDGSISTIDSIGVNVDGKEVLLPTVTRDGRHFTGTDEEVADQAIAEYRKTGQHLGVFATPEAATAYAQQLHADYAAGKYDQPPLPARLAVFARETAAVATQLADQVRGRQQDAGTLERWAYSGVESAGMALPIMALGAVGGTPLVMAGFGTTTAGESFHEARAQGVGLTTATAHSAFKGTVEIATEYIPAHRFLKDLAIKTPFIKAVIHQVAPELVGENVATTLQDLSDWAVLPENAEKTFTDYLQERPSAIAATTVSTLVAMGTQTTLAHGTARMLDTLGASARESKAVRRLPDKVAEFIDQAAGGATVSLPLDPFTQYWQSKQIDPALMAERLTGDPRAYARARETGEDLAVPIGSYVAQIGANAEHNAFFTQEARLHPFAPNAREEGALDEAAAAAIAAVPAEAPGAGQVRTAVLALLDRVAVPPETARVYADVYEKLFQTIGQRAGLDPVELFQRYALKVERAGFAPQPSQPPATQMTAPLEDVVGAEVAPTYARREDSLAQREQRRRSHWAELMAAVVRDAKATDPTVDPNVIRREFASRRERFEDSETQARESGRDPQTLLKAIASYGGIWWEKGGAYRGEVERLKQSSTAPDTWGGVKGVFRQKGKTPDSMVEALRQDPRFAHITDINVLLDELDAAVREPVTAETLPGSEDLPQALGIRLGSRWWERAAPAAEAEGPSFFQEVSNGRIGQLEERIRTARASGRDDLRALQELQALLDEMAGGVAEAMVPGALLDARADPTAPDFYRQPDDEGPASGPRARGLFTPGTTTIKLLEGANLSTFLHESAHFYLEIFSDVAEQLSDIDPSLLSDTQRRMVADFRVLLESFGFTGTVAEWRAQTADQKRDAHEQFARGFEAYLMEGRAPSPELRSVFARARAWLVSIYRTLQRLNVTLTPEVRQVMDRLLATDVEIEAAQQEQRLVPLFTDAIADAMGLSADQRARYRATVEAASTQARERLQAKLLAELQRERKAWWNEERATVRAQIARDMVDHPVYRALALLQRGTRPDGSPLPEGTEPFKLSKEVLVEQFGEGVLERLPRPLVYTTRTGVPPAVAAELLGFPNATALITALVNAAPIDVAIDAAADTAMRERHGDLLLDGSVADVARQAVVEAGAEVFAAELQALSAAATRQPGRTRIPVPPVATFRAIAERRIADTPIKDVRPQVFAAAARRAGDQAMAAAGRQDFRGALQAKQRQVLNAELYRAATNARALVDDATARFKPIFAREATLGARYDLAMVNAAKALLAQFQLAPPAQGAAAHVYLEQVRKYDPEAFADLEAAVEAAAQPAKPYRELTVDEFTALRDAVDSLWHLARRSKQIVIEGKTRELEDVRAELEARIQAISTPAAKRGYARAVSHWEKTKLYLMGWRAALRRVESWVDAVDGGRPDGSFRRILFTPISEAASQYRVAKTAALERYHAIVKAVEPSLKADEIAAPELASFSAPEGYTFNGHAELLHALLHTGNASNLSKLLRGRYWGSEQPDGTLDTRRWDAFIQRLWRDGVLTKAHYDYVQAVWDLLEEFKAPAQQTHHELFGRYFAEITAQPFQTPFGEYRGGYVPAIPDAEIAEDAALRADKETLEEGPSSFMFPSTGRGFTKSRIEPYAKPLALNLRIVPAHLEKVLRFIHLEPRIKDASRLVMHRGFRRAVDAFDPTVLGELVVPWLQRSAKQTIDLAAQGWGGRGADRFWRTMRRRASLNVMAGNVVNTLQQITGLSLAAIKVPPTALARAFVRYVRQPAKLTALVHEKSAFMKTRTGYPGD